MSDDYKESVDQPVDEFDTSVVQINIWYETEENDMRD